MEKNKKVLLGMSGGTDSSVAALLLQDAGYEVTGITFRFYEKTAVRNTWTMHGNCAAHWAFLIWCTMPVPCFRRKSSGISFRNTWPDVLQCLVPCATTT